MQFKYLCLTIQVYMPNNSSTYVITDDTFNSSISSHAIRKELINQAYHSATCHINSCKYLYLNRQC